MTFEEHIENQFIIAYNSIPWYIRLTCSRKKLFRVFYAQGRIDGVEDFQKLKFHDSSRY